MRTRTDRTEESAYRRVAAESVAGSLARETAALASTATIDATERGCGDIEPREALDAVCDGRGPERCEKDRATLVSGMRTSAPPPQSEPRRSSPRRGVDAVVTARSTRTRCVNILVIKMTGFAMIPTRAGARSVEFPKTGETRRLLGVVGGRRRVDGREDPFLRVHRRHEQHVRGENPGE